MRVVLAEKPSVARELAAFLGANRRAEGYLEGNGVTVTWAFGHLVGLQEPHDYDPALKRWSLAPLPFVPERFGLRVLGDDRAQQQFAIVAGLLRQASELICATDAGREGELIFRYIVEKAGVTDKPVRRLWLSSLTPDAIRQGFANLRPGRDFDTLFAAARCRSESDWLVGINATRCYTVRYGKTGVLWTIGRVQTPVLAMIVARDDEIRTFVATTYWELHTRYRGARFKRQGERLEQADAAKAALAKVQGKDLAITKVQAKEERVPPPLLYDLTTLQRDMNARWGMSAAETLETAQKLYEAKLITYPRTDSRHLSRDLHPSVRATLEDLRQLRPADVARIALDPLPMPTRVFDDTKVSDHHAILPTGKLPGGLAPREQQVYDAVVTRLLAVFHDEQVKLVTTVDALVDDVPFRATGVRILAPGWTVLYPGRRERGETESKAKPRGGSAAKSGDSGDDDEQQELPAFTVGEHGPHQPTLTEKSTTPPRPFTDSSLLAAMETAGRFVDDEELKAALKAKGLGTPATRAAVIETLLQRGYVVRDKKALRATDLGRYLIALVPHDELKSPALTGEWEGKLEQIARGKGDAAAFMQEIAAYARELVEHSVGARVDPARWGACPRCGAEVIEGQRGYGCSGWQQGCRFVLWKEYRGLALAPGVVRELLQRRMTAAPIELPESGPSYLYLTGPGQVVDVPPPQPRAGAAAGTTARGPARDRGRAAAGGKTAAPPARPAPAAPAARAHKPRAKAADAPTQPTLCPRCRSGMTELATSYACRGAAKGCTFAIPKEIAGKSITRAMAKKLINKGTTQVLKGFTGRSGREFAARLRLDEQGRVRFELEQGG